METQLFVSEIGQKSEKIELFVILGKKKQICKQFEYIDSLGEIFCKGGLIIAHTHYCYTARALIFLLFV